MATKYERGQRRPWSEFRPFMFLTIVALHVGAAAPVVWYVAHGTWPSTRAWVSALILYLISGFGIALGNHRLFTHQGYECGPVMRAILLIACGLTLQGDTEWWVRNHHRHHAFADCPGDPHSPFQYKGIKGILWSHIGWLFYKYEIPKPTRPDYLTEDRLIQLQRRWYPLLAVASFGIPFLVAGWEGLFVAGFLRIVFFLHITWSINSIAHLVGERVTLNLIIRDKFGVITRKERIPSDNSRNVWGLKLLTFGEANHALHHLFQQVAFHGWGRAVDPSKWALLLFERLGWVWDIVRPPEYEKIKTTKLKLPRDSFLRDLRLKLQIV